jgi:small subunit ribosomal protein S17
MKILSGKVISMNMNKTIIVEIKRQRIFPLYKKIIRRSSRYKVYNLNQEVKIGDIVKIESCRPRSKDIHYQVVK